MRKPAHVRERNAARTRDYYQRHKDDSEFKAKMAAQRKKWRNVDPLRARAHARLSYAVDRGYVVRPDACEQCGKECKPDGAHFTYDRPLDVRWLCRSCHFLWDRERGGVH